MYSSRGMWEDAMRVAKLFGGVDGSKQVLVLCTVFITGEYTENTPSNDFLHPAPVCI